MTASTSPADTRPAAFVAVDWGTSSLRCWLMDRQAQVLAETRSAEGMLHCAAAGFEPVLREHLRRLGAGAALPVLICGMAGARQGWLEAPYLHAPAPLTALAAAAVRVDTAGDVRILPGVAQARTGAPDVMRGEETQLLGVTEPGFSGLVCIPGTHSKWVRMEGGCIVEFSTYMTGELFALLSQHGILAHAVEAGAAIAADGAPYADGLAASQEPGWAVALFKLRAAQLLGQQPRADGAARLSGLMIGTEAADAARRHAGQRDVRLVASGALASLYDIALRRAGFTPSRVDAEAASRLGLVRAAALLWPGEGH